MSEQPDLLLRARLQLEEGNTQKALQALEEVTSPDEQQQREIRYLTGWAKVQLKCWEEAITSLAPILDKAEEELKNEQAELTDREQFAHYLLQSISNTIWMLSSILIFVSKCCMIVAFTCPRYVSKHATV